MTSPSASRPRKFARLVLLATLCSGAIACTERVATSPGDATPALVLGGNVNARALVGTTWRLVSINGAAPDVALDSAQYFRIDENVRRVLSSSARVACNSIFASVDTVGPRVRFEAIGMTRVWCGEPLGSVEQRFANSLAESAYFGVRGDTLWLYDSGLRERARLVAR